MRGIKTLRIYHLVLAISVIAAYLLGEGDGILHAWVGYGVAALLAIRLAIGLVPRTALSLRRLIPSLARPPLGQTGLRHPAISRTLVLAILLATTGAAATGILMDRGGTLKQQSIREDAFLFQLIPSAVANEAEADHGERGEEQEGKEAEEGPLGELHELFAHLILPLVGLHVAYLLMFRFDMARFMLFRERRSTIR